MSPFSTLPFIFLALLIVGTTFARATKELDSDELTSYWKSATNNQPLPEALKDLIPSEADIASGELERNPNMVNPNYLRYKDDPNMVHPNYLRYKNDQNKIHPNYLRYKKDPNMVNPNYLRYKDHPNMVHPNYLRYKNDQNKIHPNYLRYKNDPNIARLDYLGYAKDSPLNNADPKISDNYVDLGYLGRYKKDSQLNNADLGYLGQDSKANNVDLGYLGRFKKDSKANNIDLGYLGRYKKDIELNNVDSSYLGRYKKDSQLNNVDLGYLGRYKKHSQLNNVDFGYLGRYKKDSQVNNVDLGYLGRYKKDSRVNNVDLGYLGRYKKDSELNNVDLGYLGRYKKDSQLNNVDLGYLGRYKKDTNEAHLNYLRYKKDSLSNKVEYAKLLVFIPSDLHVGKKFLTNFANVHSSSSSQFASPKFMPRHVADSIPFSSAHLPEIMERFGIQPDSPWANSMKETLKSCEAKESMGEALFCATSLESMLDSVLKTIGPNYEINFISTTHLSKPASNDGAIETPQKYTLFEAAKEIEAPKKLNCHPMTYLYPVYGCHSVKDTKVYRLSLEGEDKSKVDAIAVCHMDTSDWKPDALFLLAAGLKPGDGAVCHFMQPSHFTIYASSNGAKGAI